MIDPAKRAASNARYDASEKRAASRARYDASEKGRAAHARYHASEKGRARRARYDASLARAQEATRSTIKRRKQRIAAFLEENV